MSIKYAIIQVFCSFRLWVPFCPLMLVLAWTVYILSYTSLHLALASKAHRALRGCLRTYDQTPPSVMVSCHSGMMLDLGRLLLCGLGAAPSEAPSAMDPYP